jgi:hypothetical protein
MAMANEMSWQLMSIIMSMSSISSIIMIVMAIIYIIFYNENK